MVDMHWIRCLGGWCYVRVPTYTAPGSLFEWVPYFSHTRKRQFFMIFSVSADVAPCEGSSTWRLFGLSNRFCACFLPDLAMKYREPFHNIGIA